MKARETSDAIKKRGAIVFMEFCDFYWRKAQDSRFGFPAKPDPSELGFSPNSTQAFQTVYGDSKKSGSR